MNILCHSCSAKKSDNGVNLLASLCNIYQTSEAEVRNTMEKVKSIIEKILKKKPCPASECKTENLDYIITGQKLESLFSHAAFSIYRAYDSLI